MLLFLCTVPACTESRTRGGDGDSEDAAPLQRSDAELPARALPDLDEDTDAPLSLTASDGTGLRLVALQARAVVHGPLAFTELRLTFENPEDRTLEGQFTIDLPVDAAISRFAMMIDGAWQEGEVVERQAARVAYEDFLHRKQDPALLENQAGNRFSARVFPIPARAKKELVLSYSQALTDSSAPYELPLAGLPRLDELDVEIVVEQPARDVTRIHETHFTPQNIAVPLPGAGEAIGLRRGELAVARIAAAGSMEPAPLDDLTILFDTSASRGLGFGAQVHRLGALVEALRKGGDFPLRIVAFDQEVALMFDGNASELGIEELTAIYSRRALGASDLAGALQRIANAGVPASRVLLISDGVATAGEAEMADLEEAVRRLGTAGVQRIDALVDGGLQDRPVLEALTTAGLAHAGVVADARRPAAELADKLRKTTFERVAVTVPGSRFAWPRTIEGVQPGDEVLVYAQLPADAAMTVVIQGEETAVDLVEVDTPLLERALAGARIEALTLQRSELGDEATTRAEELREQIVALSTKHRVLSDFTAMLVLETEYDYVRFGIDRNALADIMTVVDGRIELQQRAAPPDPRLQNGVLGMMQQTDGHFLASPYGTPFSVGSDDEDVWGGLTGAEIGEAFGVGRLGLVGTGRGGGGTEGGTIGISTAGLLGHGGGGSGSGFGAGSEAGFGGRGRVKPGVRLAKAKVQGSLDRDIVRRIVRAHINEIRYCYDQGLVRDPKLRGRVVLQFAIGSGGKVATSVVAESSLKDASVARCMSNAVRRWTFPRPPDGNNVVVTYPFELEPDTSLKRRATSKAPRPRPTPLPVAAPRERPRVAVPELPPEGATAYVGRMQEVMDLIAAGNTIDAIATATAWRDDAPGDVVALVALGEALEAAGRKRAAARAYGSLVDLFPARADIRRYAGQRLERLGAVGLELAIDTYREAVEQRPDHPNSHRLHAYALARAGRLREAFAAIEAGARRVYPSGRFAGVERILRDDVGLIAAAWIAAAPDRSAEIRDRVHALGAVVPTKPSTRFVMSWETDANDVDFHIRDGQGGYAFYGEKRLPSGGTLYADVTTGYGPECFAIEGEATAYPYRFDAKYYARGPMGYGMGKLQILEHDGKGGLFFDDRPFLIMRDHAHLDLGTLTRSLVR